MYKFVNLDNICIVGDFPPNPCDLSLRVPSISELVAEARKTGQMPYGNQRTPIPSYTDDLDSDIPFNSPDRVGSAMNERYMRDTIEQLERDFAEQSKKPANPNPPTEPAPPTDPAPK